MCGSSVSAPHGSQPEHFSASLREIGVILKKTSWGLDVLLSRVRRTDRWTSSGPENQEPIREKPLCVLGEGDRAQSFTERVTKGNIRVGNIAEWWNAFMASMVLWVWSPSERDTELDIWRTPDLEQRKFFSQDIQSHSSDLPMEAA